MSGCGRDARGVFGNDLNLFQGSVTKLRQKHRKRGQAHAYGHEPFSINIGSVDTGRYYAGAKATDICFGWWIRKRRPLSPLAFSVGVFRWVLTRLFSASVITRKEGRNTL